MRRNRRSRDSCLAERFLQRRRKRFRGERPRRDDDVSATGAHLLESPDLRPDEVDLRPPGDPAGDPLGEDPPVDGEGVTGRDGGPAGLLEDHAPDDLHLALQKADGVLGIVGSEGVRADHLGQPVRRVGLGLPDGAHLDEPDPVPAPRELPRALHPGEAAADDRDEGSLRHGPVILRGAGENPAVTFEERHYGREYFERLHPDHWFRNPPRKYTERNRDALRVVAPRPEDRILELGSARGDVTFLLADKAREIVGLDASDEALGMAEAGRSRRGLSNVRFVKGDVSDLSIFPDRSLRRGRGDRPRRARRRCDARVDAPRDEARPRPGGRLGIYTPDRAHYVERLKAHDFVL